MFEEIRQQVIKELCQGEQNSNYLVGINDTLIIVKRILEEHEDDLK